MHDAVTAFATKVETTQPAAFAELQKDYSMKNLQVKDDGSVWGPAGCYLDPSIDTNGR